MIRVTYKCGHEDIRDILGGFVPGPDYAGGVSVKFSIKNLSEKTIKYYTLTFVPYNAVGDVVTCSISNVSEHSVKGTGPVGKNCTQNNKILRTAWYNPSITKVVLVSAEIEYTDGTKETIDGKEIKPINAPASEDSATAFLIILSILIPLFGIILGIDNLRQKKKKSGGVYLGIGIASTIISPILLFVLPALL